MTGMIPLCKRGDFIDGSYHYDKSKRYLLVSLYLNKTLYLIFKYNGEPIYHEKTPQKLLNKVRLEIDEGLLSIFARGGRI